MRPGAVLAMWLFPKDSGHLPGDVFIDGGTSVEEDDDPDHGGGNEHLGVHAQPGEVQADLLPKILPARGAKPNIDKLTFILYQWRDRSRPLPSEEQLKSGPPGLKK